MLFSEFKDFIIKYNVIGVTVGFAFAISTTEFIKSFVSDIFIPTFYFIFGKLILQNINKVAYLKMTSLFESSLNFDNFIKGLVTWIFIITSTFILIKYFIQATLLNSIPITNPEVPTQKTQVPIEMDSQKTLLQPIQESNLYPNNNKFTLEKFYM